MTIGGGKCRVCHSRRGQQSASSRGADGNRQRRGGRADCRACRGGAATAAYWSGRRTTAPHGVGSASDESDGFWFCHFGGVAKKARPCGHSGGGWQAAEDGHEGCRTAGASWRLEKTGGGTGAWRRGLRGEGVRLTGVGGPAGTSSMAHRVEPTRESWQVATPRTTRWRRFGRLARTTRRPLTVLLAWA